MDSEYGANHTGDAVQIGGNNEYLAGIKRGKTSVLGRLVGLGLKVLVGVFASFAVILACMVAWKLKKQGYAGVQVCLCVCVCMRIYICVCVYIYIYICIYVY